MVYLGERHWGSFTELLQGQVLILLATFILVSNKFQSTVRENMQDSQWAGKKKKTSSYPWPLDTLGFHVLFLH